MDSYTNFESSQMNYADFPTVYYGALDVFTAATPNSPAMNYGVYTAKCVPAPPVCAPTIIDISLTNERLNDFS